MNNNKQAFSPYFNADDASILFTVPELAEYLGIGRNRAYELLRSQIIKGFRIGASWKVSKSAVDKYILEKSGII